MTASLLGCELRAARSYRARSSSSVRASSAAAILEGEGGGGERARLVEDDLADAPRPVEEARAPDEEPRATEAGEHQLVGDRRGDAEGAGARHHQHRDGDLEAAHPVPHREGPEPEAGARRHQHCDHVDRGHLLPEAAAPEPLAVLGAGAPEQRRQRGVGEVVLGDHAERAPADVEGARRNHRTLREVARAALSVDPGQGEGGPFALEARVDRDEVARRDQQRVALRERGAAHELDLPLGHAPRLQAVDAVALEQPASVCRQGALREEAPEEHQRDEDRQRVEIDRARLSEEEGPGRAAEGQRDPERDGDVEVEHAAAEPFDRAAKEDAAAHQHRDDGEGVAHLVHEGEEPAFGEAQVDGCREEHGVAGQGDGDARAQQELVDPAVLFLERRPEDVAEAFDVGDEIAKREAPVDGHVDAAEGRVDDDARPAALVEELLHQPDARGAMDPLKVHAHLTEPLALIQSAFVGLEPLVVPRSPRRLRDRDASRAPQIVEAFEALAA